jgi:Uma2 family endonuclease
MSTGAMIEPVVAAEPSTAGVIPSAEPTPIEPFAPGPDPPVASVDLRRRFTAVEVERLYDLGFLAEEESYELIDGDLIAMARVRATHASAIMRLVGSIPARLGDRASYVVQTPILLGEKTQPQPDFALVRHRKDGYQAAHPRPEETFLVIEVMDTTHRYDRGVKLPMYAGAGIPETWLVDLPGGQIEAHRRSADGIYLDRIIRRPGDTIAPDAFLDLVLSVSEILGIPDSETES